MTLARRNVPPSLASLVLAARTRAGLSQRELARRAGTTQSVVARIEIGQTSPTIDTLQRLLAAAGFEVQPTLVPAPSLDPQVLDDVQRILRLSPEDRLLEVASLSRFITSARRV